MSVKQFESNERKRTLAGTWDSFEAALQLVGRKTGADTSVSECVNRMEGYCNGVGDNCDEGSGIAMAVSESKGVETWIKLWKG